MTLDVVPSGDWSRTRFFQCVLHIFSILNTNDKSKLEKICKGTTSYLYIIYIYGVGCGF